MDVMDVLRILNEKGEVSRETWKPLSVKKNKDGTVDVLYKNRIIGTDDDPVFLWIYANIVEDDGFDVKVLERITFKKEDIRWILRYAQP